MGRPEAVLSTGGAHGNDREVHRRPRPGVGCLRPVDAVRGVPEVHERRRRGEAARRHASALGGGGRRRASRLGCRDRGAEARPRHRLALDQRRAQQRTRRVPAERRRNESQSRHGVRDRGREGVDRLGPRVRRRSGRAGSRALPRPRRGAPGADRRLARDCRVGRGRRLVALGREGKGASRGLPSLRHRFARLRLG